MRNSDDTSPRTSPVVNGLSLADELSDVTSDLLGMYPQPSHHGEGDSTMCFNETLLEERAANELMRADLQRQIVDLEHRVADLELQVADLNRQLEEINQQKVELTKQVEEVNGQKVELANEVVKVKHCSC